MQWLGVASIFIQNFKFSLTGEIGQQFLFILLDLFLDSTVELQWANEKI